MKIADMNAREKKAFKNILHAANDLIGGLENIMMDYPEDSEEYKNAELELADHDGLVTWLYTEATTTIYDEGACFFGKAAEAYLKDIRFFGKDWLIERCDRRIRKMGY